MPATIAPERSAARPSEAWCPFGLGGRRCIGEDFALMEATIAIAALAQRFELRLEPGAVVEGGLPFRKHHIQSAAKS